MTYKLDCLKVDDALSICYISKLYKIHTVLSMIVCLETMSEITPVAVFNAFDFRLPSHTVYPGTTNATENNTRY